VLPSRLGIRFALEALFLLLLAIGAGLADLRPLLIIVVVGVGWILVALIEITAERIARSPVTYLLPPPMEVEHEEAPRVFMPRPEERTVVAPPEPEPEMQEKLEEEPAVAAHVPEFEPMPEPEPEPVVEAEPEPEQIAEVEPEPVEESVEQPERRRRFLRRREPEAEPEPELGPEPELEPEPVAEGEPEKVEEPVQEPRRRRRFFRRREPEVEEEIPEPPRHVKLLPRRSEPESSPMAREVAELFGDESKESGR
jgi:hypothetical protein